MERRELLEKLFIGAKKQNSFLLYLKLLLRGFK